MKVQKPFEINYVPIMRVMGTVTVVKEDDDGNMAKMLVTTT